MKRRAIEYQADMADQDVIGSTNSCEADCGHRVGGALWCRNLPAPHRRWESEGVGVSRRFLGSWPHGPGNLCEAAGALWLGSDARGLRGTVLDGEGRRRAAGLVSTGLRAMLVPRAPDGRRARRSGAACPIVEQDRPSGSRLRAASPDSGAAGERLGGGRAVRADAPVWALLLARGSRPRHRMTTSPSRSRRCRTAPATLARVHHRVADARMAPHRGRQRAAV